MGVMMKNCSLFIEYAKLGIKNYITVKSKKKNTKFFIDKSVGIARAKFYLALLEGVNNIPINLALIYSMLTNKKSTLLRNAVVNALLTLEYKLQLDDSYQEGSLVAEKTIILKCHDNKDNPISAHFSRGNGPVSKKTDFQEQKEQVLELVKKYKGKNVKLISHQDEEELINKLVVIFEIKPALLSIADLKKYKEEYINEQIEKLNNYFNMYLAEPAQIKALNEVLDNLIAYSNSKVTIDNIEVKKQLIYLEGIRSIIEDKYEKNIDRVKVI